MPDFSGVSAKIERAKRHIDDLETEITKYHETEPYEVVSERHPETDQIVCKVGAIRSPLPSSVALLAGDAIHNLRASLDHFAFAVVPSTRDPLRVAFPVIHKSTGRTPQAFRGVTRSCLQGAPEALVAAVAALNAYKGGDHEYIWVLAELDNIDKHRLLLTVGSAYTSVVLSEERTYLRLGLTAEEAAAMPPLRLRPADKTLLRPGTELFIAEQEWFEQNSPPQFRFDVALGEPGPVTGEPIAGEPVVPTLRQHADRVEGLVKSLAALA